jgi:RimJ/RimL family protein N-acetyltransferase
LTFCGKNIERWFGVHKSDGQIKMEKLYQTLIKGKTITLKQLSEKFFDEYHHMFSPTVRKVIGLSPSSELKETTEFLRAAMVDPQHLMFYCIFDNHTNKLIGSIATRNPEHPNGQLGAWVNENFRGGGRYQEALFLALNEYFKFEEHNQIFAFVLTNNERSLRAHQKNGFEIIETAFDGKVCLQGYPAHKIVLTRVGFEKAKDIYQTN